MRKTSRRLSVSAHNETFSFHDLYSLLLLPRNFSFSALSLSTLAMRKAISARAAGEKASPASCPSPSSLRRSSSFIIVTVFPGIYMMKVTRDATNAVEEECAEGRVQQTRERTKDELSTTRDSPLRSRHTFRDHALEIHVHEPCQLRPSPLWETDHALILEAHPGVIPSFGHSDLDESAVSVFDGLREPRLEVLR